ncbi:superoxide dismutase [Cu-Zn]-like isoform X2 [Ischnura elegans]|uniref:superoxide dismutase [Cu-Zn]-like isoform X2 n=1 Tax=Ischnura elegans TaxID=197161 RepID=UPI001ED89209|nr:superoxide dismutase [Cu-Zn]-like isoform X2 [Ischnura elegans]
MASFGRIAVIFAVCMSFSAAEQIRAIVALHGSVVSGNVTFTQDEYGGPVTLTGVIMGLSPGNHGMHVHEKGDLSGGCASSGGHFNPEMVHHGAPSAAVRHVGDLGNIRATSQGTATITAVDSVISLIPTSPHSIVGRTLVIHAGEDDYGLGGYSDSLTTGHAGARVACGIIGIINKEGPATLPSPYFYPQPQGIVHWYHW